MTKTTDLEIRLLLLFDFLNSMGRKAFTLIAAGFLVSLFTTAEAHSDLSKESIFGALPEFLSLDQSSSDFEIAHIDEGFNSPSIYFLIPISCSTQPCITHVFFKGDLGAEYLMTATLDLSKPFSETSEGRAFIAYLNAFGRER